MYALAVLSTTIPSVGDALSLLMLVLGVIGLAGGAVGYFAKGRGDSIIAYQSNEIQLRDGTIARIEKENTELKASKEQLEKHVEYLQNLSQGSPELKKLTRAIEANNKLITKAMAGR